MYFGHDSLRTKCSFNICPIKRNKHTHKHNDMNTRTDLLENVETLTTMRISESAFIYAMRQLLTEYEYTDKLETL